MTRTTLNADQQNAIKAISTFIISGKKEFFLTGGPGVGKTFTTRELGRVLPEIVRNYNKAMGKHKSDMVLELTSTTNKAAAVLSFETGIEAQTIHSFLGLKPVYDFSSGKTYLKKTPKWQVHSNIILFVDEASMVERNLYQLIQEATDDTCRIIYIGDKNQLPPVMEKLSPAVILSSNPASHYEITTPVRNANSPALLDLCERLRQDIMNGVSKTDLTHWPHVPGQIEYINGEKLRNLIDLLYGPSGTIKSNDDKLACRILAYTNARVIGYNQHIRTLRGLPEHPTAGEVLICNDHFPLSRSHAANVEDAVKIHEIEGPIDVPMTDGHNFLAAYKITVSTAFSGRHRIFAPAKKEDFKNLQSHYKKLKDWERFYNLKNKFIDLRDREAATVYKAQGSTYDSVIMIMDDIFSSRDINQLRRMLYVGASRARNKIYVYDKNIYENSRGIYKKG